MLTIPFYSRYSFSNCMTTTPVRLSPDTHELLIRAKGFLMQKYGKNIGNDETIKRALLKLIENEDQF